MGSGSIDEAPVSRNARNLVTAIPVLASSAATTALVLPSVDMRRRVSGTPKASPSGGVDALPGQRQEHDDTRQPDQDGRDVQHPDDAQPGGADTSDDRPEQAG